MQWLSVYSCWFHQLLQPYPGGGGTTKRPNSNTTTSVPRSKFISYCSTAWAAVIKLIYRRHLHYIHEVIDCLFNPCNTGPTAAKPPRRSAILYPMLPVFNTRKIALLDYLLPGAFKAVAAGTKAAYPRQFQGLDEFMERCLVASTNLINTVTENQILFVE